MILKKQKLKNNAFPLTRTKYSSEISITIPMIRAMCECLGRVVSVLISEVHIGGLRI